MANRLWAFTMKVAAPAGQAFPGSDADALASTYVGAPDHETAMRMGVSVSEPPAIATRDEKQP